MNEILLNIISVVVTAVVIPLISLLGSKLYELINSKIKNEKGAKCLTEASEIVLNAVRFVFQTYVESLKKSGSFDKDVQIEALNLAKNIVLSQLSAETKTFISSNYGDLNEWLITSIEAGINKLKNQ